MKLKSLQLTAATLVSSMILVACGTDGDIDEPALTTATPSSAAENETIEANSLASAADSAPAESDTRAASIDKDTADGEYSTEPTEQFGGSYGKLRTTDIRVGSHDDFDRLVFEFTGQGDPQYHVGYNDDPRQQASGFPIGAPGNAKLEINIHGTAGDMAPDAKYAGMKELGLASGSILEVVNGGTFEADSQYVVGLDSRRPYKVTVLHEPTRLVVDFKK